MPLVDDFYSIIPISEVHSEKYTRIESALKHYEEILHAVSENSLARDGWEMIESAMRDMTDE